MAQLPPPTRPMTSTSPGPPETGSPIPTHELARRWVTSIATMLAGLLAGFFVTYAISVTRGLAIADHASYVEVMNAINATVSTPAFGLIFFGAPAFASVAAAIHLSQPARLATWACVTGAVALIACVAITAGINVPLNRELADAADTATISAADARAAYEDAWNRANLLRATLSSLGFTALLLASTARGRTTT